MSVAGTWNVTTKTPMGDQTGTFTVVVDGDRFTGSVANPMGEMEVLNGRVSGNTLTWAMDMTAPMPMTLDCEATVSGDSISGTVKAGMFGSMAMNGTRAA